MVIVRLLVQTLLGNNTDLDLRQAIKEAGNLQPIDVSEQARASVWDFVNRRLEQRLVDNDIAVEVARAILNERGNYPVLAKQSALELQARIQCSQGQA